MPRRRGRPGLVGTMARTAVVAGTATAVVGGVKGHSDSKQAAAEEQAAANQAAYESQAQIAELQAQVAAQQTAPAPPQDDMMTKLKELGELHAAGVLTDDEFATAKAKLLA
ncbi:MAG: SHOCT domain-containing protein [Acidimicrobiia bacterium]